MPPGADFEVVIPMAPDEVERENVTAGFVVPAATPAGITISMTLDVPDPDRIFKRAIEEIDSWSRGPV